MSWYSHWLSNQIRWQRRLSKDASMCVVRVCWVAIFLFTTPQHLIADKLYNLLLIPTDSINYQLKIRMIFMKYNRFIFSFFVLIFKSNSNNDYNLPSSCWNPCHRALYIMYGTHLYCTVVDDAHWLVFISTMHRLKCVITCNCIIS